ncbi:MAG TPA: patatin-like phospholipase family protein [Myxococcaceae bacterium]|nr:patatin-like phospholipase family protein [Myxococcaceae bacterium]
MLPGLLLLTFVAAGAAPELGRVEDPYTVTVSGGVSLGTYESGLTWAVVRLSRGALIEEEEGGQRRPTVLAITGASAGSINALLSGALWCESAADSRNRSVDDNLLRQTWVEVGLDALLPRDASHYQADDGLLASEALMPIVNRIRTQIFSPDGMRFQPGCRLPVGFTVTRVIPEEIDVSGLKVPIQRAVSPLVFEIDAGGAPTVSRQQLSGRWSPEALLRLADSIDASGTHISPDSLFQSLLASAAFPLAFGARPLCECNLRCNLSEEVTASSCPGPDTQHPLKNLSCAAYSNALGGREISLCKSYFVDGGVFDNAPVGLAIDQADSFARQRILHPLTAIYLDPDTRRLEPPPKEAADRTARGVTGAIDLGFTLVGTARKRDLAESVGSRRWNLTTRNVLWRSALLLTETASLLLQLTDLSGEPPEVPAPPVFRGTAPERIRLARTLLSCVRRLAAAEPGPEATALDLACAAAARGEPGRDVLAGDAEELARVTVQLSDEDLVRMAEALGVLASDANARRRSEDVVLRNRRSTAAERQEVAEVIAQRAQLAAAVLTLLADELPRIAHGNLSDDALRHLRTSLLSTVELARSRSDRVNRLANARVADELRRVAARNTPLAPAVEASRALAALAGTPATMPFALQPVEGVVGALRVTPPAELDDALRSGWSRLERLVQLRGRLGTITSAAIELSEQAAELRQDTAGERRLMLTTRFSPLAGSQLANFGGFLDRPLREADYYIGVYDGIREAAVRWCDLQDPYETPRPAPARKADGSGELDFTQEATQRCLGAAMGLAARWLRLLESPKANAVVRTLAGRELAAWMGSVAEGERLARLPEWQWLGRTPPDLRSVGDVGKVLIVLLGDPIACEPGASERLCYRDPDFDTFMAGLVREGYAGESQSMRTALTSRSLWFKQTAARAVDRAATVEIEHPSVSDPGLEEGVNVGIGATELLTRKQGYETGVRFILDPSTIPGRPLANGSYLPIVLAHLIPYRVALDVVGGGLALSWIEPELWLFPWLSLDTTLQLVDIQFSPGVTSTTLGLRAIAHVGPLGVGGGPRWSFYWSGPDASNFGVEFDLTFFQDRFGVSFGFRNVTPSGWYTPFVALTIADLNGALYWLIPSAWRSGR